VKPAWPRRRQDCHSPGKPRRSPIKTGKTLDQMKQAKLLDPWKKYAGQFINADAFIETLYNSLTGQKNGKFIKHN
jgi:hypothetical protein